MIQLTHEPIDYHALTESVRSPHCGAVVTFLGTVRDLTGDRVTVALNYEAYPGMAEKKLAEIEADTRARWPVVARHGSGEGGEEVVWLVGIRRAAVAPLTLTTRLALRLSATASRSPQLGLGQ